MTGLLPLNPESFGQLFQRFAEDSYLAGRVFQLPRAVKVLSLGLFNADHGMRSLLHAAGKRLDRSSYRPREKETDHGCEQSNANSNHQDLAAQLSMVRAGPAERYAFPS